MPNIVGREALSLASGVVGVLASVPPNADAIRFRVEGASMRWSLYATPNASLGLLAAPADETLTVGTPSVTQFRVYPLVAGQVNVEYLQGGDTFKL